MKKEYGMPKCVLIFVLLIIFTYLVRGGETCARVCACWSEDKNGDSSLLPACES